MMDVRFQPLSPTTWPRKRRPANARNGSPFKAGYPKTLEKLEHEIDKLNGKNIVIEADFARGDIRNDGWPRAGVRPADSGVIVNFTSKYGPLRLPCDYFADWTANLRAIALHLERLRLASLYGVGDYGEQYKGWLRLGAGDPGAAIATGAGAMTVEEAARTIEKRTGVNYEQIVKNAETYRATYRVAAARTHPDANAGRDELWIELQGARTVLDAHHGIAKNAGGA